MKATSQTVGLLLAGGESRRMGKDKALLPIEGYPDLLHRQLALLQSLSLDRYLVSRHQRHGELPLAGAELLIDQNQGQHEGPLAGIAAALNACPDATELLVLPVDLPCMTRDVLESLLESGRRLRQGLYFEGEYLPLYLPVTSSLRSDLAQRLGQLSSDKSIRGMLRRENAAGLPVPDSLVFTNTNTPEEWQACQIRPHSF
ncbi:molybdenum cofactor guanylyltransferase [Parathalassolituus penaei]|uniref:Molybdenum cofactor guanylyltransferase n=1 Tax=Parathalassolituus penaei TaxID=2997323 RepID=A0A9X3ECH8_9GAMM|nr:molybdenum cofactor guanylyltransferase [Parathalassolituus penaei]MCY0965027.1 molybdenum cofactor guanylyltransferase [Parathalassolituus penaei]